MGLNRLHGFEGCSAPPRLSSHRGRCDGAGGALSARAVLGPAEGGGVDDDLRGFAREHRSGLAVALPVMSFCRPEPAGAGQSRLGWWWRGSWLMGCLGHRAVDRVLAVVRWACSITCRVSLMPNAGQEQTKVNTPSGGARDCQKPWSTLRSPPPPPLAMIIGSSWSCCPGGHTTKSDMRARARGMSSASCSVPKMRGRQRHRWASRRLSRVSCQSHNSTKAKI